MQEIILFTTDCPKCKVLKKKLIEKSIEFVENHSIEDMENLGILQVPVLKIEDRLYNFAEAVKWINNK